MKNTPRNIAALVKSIGRSDAANYLVAEGHAATLEEANQMLPNPLADSTGFFKPDHCPKCSHGKGFNCTTCWTSTSQQP